MKIPTKYRHIGGVKNLKVGAESIDIYGKRVLFAWEDGEKIIGCPSFYDIDRFRDCFEIVEYRNWTLRDVAGQWFYGIRWLLGHF